MLLCLSGLFFTVPEIMKNMATHVVQKCMLIAHGAAKKQLNEMGLKSQNKERHQQSEAHHGCS
jgi:hypothetical protein